MCRPSGHIACSRIGCATPNHPETSAARRVLDAARHFEGERAARHPKNRRWLIQVHESPAVHAARPSLHAGGTMTRGVRVLAVAALLVIPGGSWAQQGTTELRGTLRDGQGGVLPGVTVVVRNQDTGMFREAVSNADGTY